MLIDFLILTAVISPTEQPTPKIAGPGQTEELSLRYKKEQISAVIFPFFPVVFPLALKWRQDRFVPAPSILTWKDNLITMTMNHSLAHLPAQKQRQLEEVTAIIVKAIDPEKVILFGSHATGKWVEDWYVEDHISHEYISDYDILVITRQGDMRKDYEVQDLIKNRTARYRNPVMPIVHDIDYVNKMLGEGHYFFSDIEKEGIMLYDAGRVELADRRELTAAEKKVLAQEHYDHWFETGKECLDTSIYCHGKGNLKLGVFVLHQAAERTYNAVELVFTGYKPNTHSLAKLRKYTWNFSRELASVFPDDTSEEVHLFDLLKRGYVDARYKKDYKITPEELQILIERIGKLQDIAERICKEKIEGFQDGISPC